MSESELRRDLNARAKHDRTAREYHDAVKTVLNTSPSVPPELNHIHTKLPWCQLAVSVLEERLDIKEITAEDPAVMEYLRKVWVANNGQEKASKGHTEAMAIGRAYLAVTPSDDPDVPLIQVIRADQMVHKTDTYTGKVTEALRVYGKNRDRYAYYSPGSIKYYATDNGRLVHDPDIPVHEIPSTDEVPVFPLISRAEIDDRWGRPEAKAIYSIQDSGTRAMTDLSVASTLMAAPQRVLTNASDEDLQDEAGNPISPSKLYMARLLMLSNPDSGVTQFQAAQLQNFTTAVNSLARQAASLMGISTSVFGITSDANPVSGDGQREGDMRLVHRAERIGRGFKQSWVNMNRYIAIAYGGFSKEQASTINVEFVNPATPTVQAQADAIVKYAAVTVAGQPLFTRRALLKEMGKTDEQIDQMDAEDEDGTLRGFADGPEESPSPSGEPIQGAIPASD